MGSFKGHALPGSFFLVFGIWWTGKHSLWYATRRNKNIGSSRLAGRALQRHLEIIESAVILFFAVVGILAEQYAANGPAFHLYNSVEKHWIDLMNWQHSTMYLFFGMMGGVSLVIHTTDAAPLALDRLMLALAFFTEGFLFLYHLHGRAMLDVLVHQLLLYSVFGSALVAFLEIFHRGNILLELLRCTLTVLQGSWFWEVKKEQNLLLNSRRHPLGDSNPLNTPPPLAALLASLFPHCQIGFVLYPPHGPEWDLSDHSNMMFITMCYAWHLALAMLIVGVLHCLVSCGVRTRLKRTPPMEMGLLKQRERDPESEDEIL